MQHSWVPNMSLKILLTLFLVYFSSNIRNIRNSYKNKLNARKSEYIQNKINEANDQKSMWKNTKSFVLKKSKNEILDIIVFDNENISDNLIIANKFNKYFVESIRSIYDNIIFCQYVE